MQNQEIYQNQQNYPVLGGKAYVFNRPFKSSLPARKTLHNEIVTLRLVLKSATRHGWLAGLPDLSPPFRKQGKVSHRPWFSPAEYKQLYTATREYAQTVPPHIRWSAEQVHDFVLFMANIRIAALSPAAE